MRMQRSLAALGFVAMVAATEAQAQVVFEVTPFTGGTFFLADPPNRFALGHRVGAPTIIEGGAFDDAWTVGLNTGIRINELWAVEAMFSWLPTKLSATSGLTNSVDVNGYMYGVTGLFYLPIEGRVKPFVGVGFGAETFDYDLAGVESDTELMGNVLGGLYFELGDRLGLRLEARDCFARFDPNVSGVDHKWENDLMTTVGLSFRIPRN